MYGTAEEEIGLNYDQFMPYPQNFGQHYDQLNADNMRISPGFGYGRPGYGYGYGRPGFGFGGPGIPLGLGFLGGLATGALLAPGPGFGYGYGHPYGGYGGYGGYPYPPYY